MTDSIHPGTNIGAVALMTSNLARSVDFYQDAIGLRVRQRRGRVAVLGTDLAELLILQEKPGARIVPRRTGLFYFDILLPSRPALAQSLHRLIETHTLITGFVDQRINEVVYISDPDGYGIALSSDRPRNMWTNFKGDLSIRFGPMDVDGLLAEIDGSTRKWTGIADAARIGSVHLNVNNLDKSEKFYCGVLGFRHTAELAGARFLSAGDYHHHIGLNTWSGQGAPLPPEETLRIIAVEILLPNPAALAAVRARMEQAGHPFEAWHGGWLTHDPSQNPILLRVS